MRRPWRVLASALLGLLVGLLTTILLVVPAGAAFVSGGKASERENLENAPNPKIRQQIINGRIRHLESEISTFRQQIRDITGE